MGAPEGNNNRQEGRIWRAAIRRALEKRSAVDRIDAIEKLAEALIDKAQEGDIQALKEIGDRLEGKSKQQVELEGNPDAPVISEVRWTVIDAKAGS